MKRPAKICIGLGGYFSKHTKKTVKPQEDVELLEENENDSAIPGHSSPPIISGNVQVIRGYTEKEYNELANENEEGINKGDSIMDILPANACRINAESLLPNQPLNFSYPTRVFNNRKRSFKRS